MLQIISMGRIDINEVIQSLYCVSVTAHVAHVNTRSFSQHEALGDFYEKANAFKDRFIEYCMGAGYINQVMLEEIDSEDLMEELEEACDNLYAFAEECDDETLMNMYADFLEAKNKLKYMLMFK